MTLKFYSPAGVEIEFSMSPGSTYQLLNSYNGFSQTQVTHITRQAPYQDGAKLIDSRIEPREISLDVMVTAPTLEDLQYAIRVLTTTLNPLAGVGTLIYTQEDGSQYALFCVGNNTPTISPGERDNIHQLVTIDLIAHDPFWYSYPNTIAYFGAGTPITFPYQFPWAFPTSTPAQVCTNAGNLSSGVTITISGAITNPSITRTYTEPDGTVVTETLAFTLTTTAGEKLTITTGPGNKTITYLDASGNEQSNPFQYLDSGYAFWQMVPGENTVTVSSSAIDAATTTSVEWASKFTGL